MDQMNEYFFETEAEINNPLNSYVSNIHEFIPALTLAWKKADFTIIYKPERDDLDELLRKLYLCGNVTLIYEEVHLASRSRQENLYKILTTGRHKNLSVISTAQRPFAVSRDLTAQSDFIISFRQTEQRDIKYLQEYGEASDLRSLKVGQYKFIFGDESQIFN